MTDPKKCPQCGKLLDGECDPQGGWQGTSDGKHVSDAAPAPTTPPADDDPRQ
jgi:hypothetical protein